MDESGGGGRILESRNTNNSQYAYNHFQSNRHMAEIQESLNNSLGSYNIDEANNNSFLENSFLSNGHFQ